MKKFFTLASLSVILFSVKAQNLIPYEAEGYMGFKNKTGEIAIDARYKYPRDFHDGLLRTSLDDKIGFVDITGKIVIPFIYKEATNFYKGFAVAQLNNSVFIIDRTGKEYKKLKYTSLTFSKDDVATVGLDGKYGMIAKNTGKEIVPPIYDAMRRFNDNGERPVKLGEKWGIIDKQGVVIVPIQYDAISHLVGTTYQVKISEKYGALNLGLKPVPDVKYDYMIEYPDDAGFFMVGAGGKFGFINELGNEIIPLKYDFARDFYEGFATVEKEGRWYFLNNQGEELPVGTENFENVSGLMNGFALVKLKGKSGFIDKDRKLVVPIIYDDTSLYSDGRAKVKLDNKWGLINESGEIIIPIEYDEVKYHDDDLNIKARKDGNDFFFDSRGNTIPETQK